MKHITAEEAKELIENGDCSLLVDVRSHAEFRASHIPGARNMPLDELEQDIGEQVKDKDATLFLMCSCGNRSDKACEEMQELGYHNVISIEGGIIEMKRLGMKIIEEQHHTISIERQVRIVAGSLVLIGLILGFTLHPGYFAISALIGSGLLFAGITDTCGLGLLLARMPWNK
jgi:rhodanese-related sulfurtransferase